VAVKGPNLTHAGLKNLKSFGHLRELRLDGCFNITRAGLNDFQRALPSCKITH